MSSFIVETSDELPRILLFVSNQFSRQKVILFLQQKGFSLDVFTLDERIDAAFFSQPLFRRGEWYKIIVWADELFLPSKINSLVAVAEFLSNRDEEKIFVGSTLTPIQTSDVFPAWVEASFQQQQSLLAISSLSRSTYFLAENVIPEEERFALDRHPLAYMQTPENADLVLVPRQELHFITEVVAIDQFLSLILKPKQSSTFIQGDPALFCSSILKEWGSVREIDCSLTALDFKNEKMTESVIRDLHVSQKLKEFLHQKVTPAEVIRSTEPFQETEMRVKGLQVVPVRQPVIENRQKNYEKRIGELNKQKMLRKKIPRKGIYKQNYHGQPSKVNQEKMDKHLEGQIVSLFGQQRVQQKEVRVTKKVKRTIHIKEKSTRQIRFSVFIAVILTVVGFFAGLSLLFILSQKVVAKSVLSLADSSTQTSQSQKQSQVNSLSLLSKIFATQVDGYKFFLGKQVFPFSTQLSAMSEEIVDANLLSQESSHQKNQLVSQVFAKETGDVFDTFLSFSSKAKDQYQKLSLLQSQLQNLESQELSDDQLKTLKEFGNKMQEERKSLASFQQFEQAFPSIFAQHQRKTYLVLLQNTQELRPTGGFLQTVAFLTVENGVIINHQVLDVKTIDTALSGQINPPEEIKALLGQTKWYLRDSNWSPDFSVSGPQAMWFVEKGIGKKVDGVLAINTQVLQKLIQPLGQLPLTQYNEVITDKNLMEKIEFHSEIPLAKPGDQEYTTVLFGTFLDQLSSANSEKITAVSGQLYDSLKSGESFLYTNEDSVNSVLKSLGWTGEVVSPECPAQMSDGPCVVDTAMQVEANVGINKANYYVQRSVKDSITIGEKTITHQRTIQLINNSTTNAWPSGSYKSYIRLYVPKSAQLGEIRIDDVPVESKLISVASEKEKTYFGTRVEVPIQKTVNVTFEYSEPLDVSGSFAYTFFNQRQAGTGESPLEVVVTAEGRRPVRIAPQAEVMGNEVKFTLTQDKHSFVGVKYN